MKNPLRKRYLRELKSEFGKYLAIFIFMAMLSGLISGFLVALGSVKVTYNEGFTKYNLEDGHIAFNQELPEDVKAELEDRMDLKFYDLMYADETVEENNTTLRIYKKRTQVDLECLMSGAMPAADDEIAIDRMYAVNNEIKVGDTITIHGRSLKVCGYIAAVDYSSLFKSNTDMMFDALGFGISIMTDSGYEALDSAHNVYNYAWKYNEAPADKADKKARSDDFIAVLEEVITKYDRSHFWWALIDNSRILNVEDYVPEYLNQAIHFVGDDMGSDEPMMIIIDYLAVIILAFVFAVTMSNTIVQEAGVIGTLRASGYTRGELVGHYMVLPTGVSLLAALIGNICGYTFLEDYVVSVYYNSYSLATYETYPSIRAFVITTAVPILLMLIINLSVLSHKMRLSPQQFLRHDTSRKRSRRAVKLSPGISFMTRFRLRILLHNLSSYIVLFIGILFGGIMFVFGTMFVPLLDDYAEMIPKSMLSAYQYVLMKQVETENTQAEKYCVTSLDSMMEGFMTDEVTIYGIEDTSAYVQADIPAGQVIVSNGIMDKFGLEKGQELTLKDPYSDKTYFFTVAGDYKYDAALCLFMGRADYLETFGENEDYFNGYFSNEELTDIDVDDVATIITEKDLIKAASQLKVSMGSFMVIFQVFGIIIFLLLMYLLTKQLIDKSCISISMTKILGYSDNEIAGLYLLITSIVVGLSLLICIPIIDLALRWVFSGVLYMMITGYIPYIVSNLVYVKLVITGALAYALVAFFMMFKINRIPKSDALKMVE